MPKDQKINKNVAFDFENNIFRKHITQDKFESELEMSLLANTIGSTSNLFNTPSVSGIDREKCLLEFELIQEAITVRKYFVDLAKWGASPEKLAVLEKTFFKLGQSIYLIHSTELGSIDIAIKEFPNGFLKVRTPQDKVLIHGDFTLSNILISPKTKRINIIDWSTSPIYEFSANVGPRYWDLSFFISSLYYFSYSTFLSIQVRISLVKAFLSGYLQDTDIVSTEFLKDLSDFLKSYNYYELYYSNGLVKTNSSNRFLIARSRKKLNQLITKLPSLITES